MQGNSGSGQLRLGGGQQSWDWLRGAELGRQMQQEPNGGVVRTAQASRMAAVTLINSITILTQLPTADPQSHPCTTTSLNLFRTHCSPRLT